MKGNQRSGPGQRPLVEDAKDGQWLGVSLARKPGINGKVVVGITQTLFLPGVCKLLLFL